MRSGTAAQRRITLELVDHEAQVSDPEARVAWREGGRLQLRFDPRRVDAGALVARLARDHALRDLIVEEAPIEEVIEALYQAQGGAPSLAKGEAEASNGDADGGHAAEVKA